MPIQINLLYSESDIQVDRRTDYLQSQVSLKCFKLWPKGELRAHVYCGTQLPRASLTARMAVGQLCVGYLTTKITSVERGSLP